MKIKLDLNDKIFSIMIRERDNHTCVFCGRKAPDWKIDNSHYWGRGDKIHRFDPLNCDALCFMCHNKHESNKQGFYREWKLKQLGEEKHRSMEIRHDRETKKYGEYEKKLLQGILKEQYANKAHLQKGWKVEW